MLSNIHIVQLQWTHFLRRFRHQNCARFWIASCEIIAKGLRKHRANLHILTNRVVGKRMVLYFF